MKTLKKLMLSVLCLTTLNIAAQTEQKKNRNSGEMNATTTKSFTFEKDGKAIPYQVTIQENRDYIAKLNKKDDGRIDQDRVTTPAMVSKLIMVHNKHNAAFNRLIVLRYEKQVTDTFEVVATKNGFAVNVDDKSMNYIFDEGIYFANTADEDFFVVDVFDYML